MKMVGNASPASNGRKSPTSTTCLDVGSTACYHYYEQGSGHAITWGIAQHVNEAISTETVPYTFDSQDICAAAIMSVQ